MYFVSFRRDGPKKRDKPEEDWKPPISQAELEKRQNKNTRSAKTGGILSKFRKESTEKKPGKL